MITKEAPTAGTKPRATMVIQQVREDVSEIRQRLEISPILKKEDLPNIIREAVSMKEAKGRDYNPYYYEIGHRMLTDHIIASMRQSINLNDDEAKLFSDASGRLSFNVPVSENQISADALQKMQDIGMRARDIFDEAVRLYKKFGDMMAEVRNEGGFVGLGSASDLFGNPYSKASVSYLSRSFGVMALRRREKVAKAALHGESKDVAYL